MSQEMNPIKDALLAQRQLKAAVLDQIAEITVFLRTVTDREKEVQLLRKQDALSVQFRELQSESLVIIAAGTKGDIDIIKQVSTDVTKFVHNVENVKKALKVISALIVFVAAAMEKDPKSIGEAAADLYKAMNEIIKEEGQKGDKAAVKMKPFPIPKLVDQAAKAKAKAKLIPKEPAPKPGPAKKVTSKPASRKPK